MTIMINMMMTLMSLTNLYHPDPLSWPSDSADHDDNDHHRYNHNHYCDQMFSDRNDPRNEGRNGGGREERGYLSDHSSR